MEILHFEEKETVKTMSKEPIYEYILAFAGQQSIFCLVVGGGGWQWMVVDIFWLVVGGGEYILAGGGCCWMVVGGGIVQSNQKKDTAGLMVVSSVLNIVYCCFKLHHNFHKTFLNYSSNPKLSKHHTKESIKDYMQKNLL